MTIITIQKKSDGSYAGFSLDGHAGSGEYGKDIVCAALSMLSINTVNSLEEFTDDKFSLDADPEKGHLSAVFEGALSHEGDLLMKSFELGVDGVYKQYGNEYLNIKLEEV